MARKIVRVRKMVSDEVAREVADATIASCQPPQSAEPQAVNNGTAVDKKSDKEIEDNINAWMAAGMPLQQDIPVMKPLRFKPKAPKLSNGFNGAVQSSPTQSQTITQYGILRTLKEIIKGNWQLG